MIVYWKRKTFVLFDQERNVLMDLVFYFVALDGINDALR